MIKQFKKWLTVGTVNSKYNLFKFAILGELILLIALVICICNNISLKKDIKNLEKVHDKNIEIIQQYNENVLEPLGLWETS
tara:strand:- start:4488 stop:4730 length:243 start_codon:yes stop_codon:yes gene_type:complete